MEGKGFRPMGLMRCSIMDMPASFYGRQEKTLFLELDEDASKRTPEENLLLSMISRAFQDMVKDLTESSDNPGWIGEDAIRWFLSPCEDLGSFLWVAQHLNLSSKAVGKFKDLALRIKRNEITEEHTKIIRFFQAKLDN